MKKYIVKLVFALCLWSLLFISILGGTGRAEAAIMKINYTSVTLEVGQTKTLTVTGASYKPSWLSKDTSVVTVSSSGKLTAKEVGSTYVLVSIKGKILQCKVTVIPAIILNNTTLTLNKGRYDQLIVSGTTKVITWTSSNRAVVTVTSQGKVKAIAKGTATITASVAGKKLRSEIKVIDPITLSNFTLQLKEGQSQYLSLKGTDIRPLWESSDTSTAYISSKGKLTALKEGTTTVTASIDGQILTCSVQVTKLQGISENTFSINIGNSLTLTAPIITTVPTTSAVPILTDTPAPTEIATPTEVAATTDVPTPTEVPVITDNPAPTDIPTLTDVPSPTSGPAPTDSPASTDVTTDNKVLWESSNAAIASVSEDGKVTALKEGTAIITAAFEGQKFTYLAIVLNQNNPYLKNSLFTATVRTYDKLSFVLPKSWYQYNEDGVNKTITLAYQDYNGGSNVIVSITKKDIDPPVYSLAKQEFLNDVNINEIQRQYDSAGLSSKIKNFKQSDYMAEFGKALKTEYQVTVEGQKMNQVFYDFYMGQYRVEFVVTDLGDKDYQKITQFILNSFVINN